MDDRQKDRPVNKFIQNYSKSSVQDCSMLEQQIADAVDISHLHIRARQEVALLVTARYSNGDIGLQTRKFVCLRGYYTDDVSLSTLDAKLADGSREISLLMGCHG